MSGTNQGAVTLANRSPELQQFNQAWQDRQCRSTVDRVSSLCLVRATLPMLKGERVNVTNTRAWFRKATTNNYICLYRCFILNTFTTFKQNWLFRDNRSQKNHCPFELKTEQRVRMEKGGVIIPKAPPQRAFNTHTRFHISLLLGLGFLSWILYSRIASEETPDYRIGQTDINRGPLEPQEEFAWTKVNILLLPRQQCN